MMILKRSAFALLITLLWSACTKPTDDVKIVIDTNVIKYSALVDVTDAANASTPPAGLTITLSGQDAGQIYEISGSKKLTVTSGIIAIGPTPTLVPTTDRPVMFNVILSAPGYTTITQAIQINAGQTQQVVSISMAPNTTGIAITQDAGNTATPANAVPVTLTFTGKCVNKGNVELHPSNYIFYRESGASTGYKYLGYMSKGSITAPLVLGRTYDFEMLFNGIAYPVTQTINQTSYSETIDMGTSLCSTF